MVENYGSDGKPQFVMNAYHPFYFSTAGVRGPRRHKEIEKLYTGLLSSAVGPARFGLRDYFPVRSLMISSARKSGSE